LLLVGAALGVGQGLPVEGGREDLVGRGLFEEIARELLDREAIEGQVVVDRIDDPVAVTPGVGAMIVLFITVTVGVAGAVEPMPASIAAR
jgi:hypothetical protein